MKNLDFSLKEISSKSFLTCCFSLFHHRTLQYHRMCDSRHAFPFIKTGLAEQGSGGEEEDFFPFTGFQLRENICCQSHGAAAAATATGMGVLGICIKDLNAAVHVPAGNIYSLLPQQIDQHCLSHASQIPR